MLRTKSSTLAGVEVDHDDLVTGGAVMARPAGGVGGAVAEEGDEGVAAEFAEGGPEAGAKSNLAAPRAGGRCRRGAGRAKGE